MNGDFDHQRMEQVFRYLKIKKEWEDVWDCYNNFDDVYKHDQFQDLSYDEIRKISEVFYFKGNNRIDKARRMFVDFLSKNKQFYNDDLDVVIYRMTEERDRLANRYPQPLRWLNSYPEYGGLLYNKKIMKNREYEWAAQNTRPLYDDENN